MSEEKEKVVVEKTDEKTKNASSEVAENAKDATVDTKAVQNKEERSEKPRRERNPRNQKGGRRPNRRFKKEKKEFEEVVVNVGRITKVVKGGRRFRFNALVVIGNKKGVIGMGTGKANEVPDAIQKAIKDARKNLITVPRVGTTIPHDIIGRHDSGRVLLKPAPKGTGVIAGGSVRPVLELAGINDIVSKSLGANTKMNMTRATLEGLKALRTKEQIAELRDIDIAKLS